MMGLLRYPVPHKDGLSNPKGSLSLDIPSVAIEKAVTKVLQAETKKGSYKR